jgi:endoglucanase
MLPVIVFLLQNQPHILTAAPSEQLPVTRVSLDGSALALGVYDPSNLFPIDPAIAVEQIYLPWRMNSTVEIMDAIHSARRKQRLPLVVIEPWPFGINDLSRETLLRDITQGRYDNSIRPLCRALEGESPQEIWIRWGHEMEFPSGMPWNQNDPPGFVAAYRQFVRVCRDASGPSNLKFMWSPAGFPALRDYWPGGQYVDIVGLTSLGFRQWEVAHGYGELSFSAIFDPRYQLVQGYGKPVVVAEFGAAGEREYQKEWVGHAFNAFPNYPLLRGVVYFNAPSVGWGGPEYTPDWRIDPRLFPPHEGLQP